MRNHRMSVSWVPWLGVLCLSACVPGVQEEGLSTEPLSVTRSAASLAVTASSEDPEHLELEAVFRFPEALARISEVMGFQCDSEPTLTFATECGLSIPTRARFAWERCEGSPKQARASLPVEAPGELGPLVNLLSSSEGAARGEVEMEGRITPASTSSCGIQQATRFSLTGARGEQVQGSFSSEFVHLPASGQWSRATTFDLIYREEGALEGIHVSGRVEVSPQTATAKAYEGNITVRGEQGDQTAYALSQVRVALSECREPTGGTVWIRRGAELPYQVEWGPRCGQSGALR